MGAKEACVKRLDQAIRNCTMVMKDCTNQQTINNMRYCRYFMCYSEIQSGSSKQTVFQPKRKCEDDHQWTDKRYGSGKLNCKTFKDRCSIMGDVLEGLTGDHPCDVILSSPYTTEARNSCPNKCGACGYADNACQVVHIRTNVSESNEPKEFKSIVDKYNGNSFSFLGMFTGYAGQSVVYVDIKNPKQFLILAPTSYNSYVWILLDPATASLNYCLDVNNRPNPIHARTNNVIFYSRTSTTKEIDRMEFTIFNRHGFWPSTDWSIRDRDGKFANGLKFKISCDSWSG